MIIFSKSNPHFDLVCVYVTMVGYCGGTMIDPTYEEVCAGKTGHAEVVQIIYDPKLATYGELLAMFWDNHNPTQGMQQGVDIGSQYRSCIFAQNGTQKMEAKNSKLLHQAELTKRGIMEKITTEIYNYRPFYYAEAYHQQYLAKNN